MYTTVAFATVAAAVAAVAALISHFSHLSNIKSKIQNQHKNLNESFAFLSLSCAALCCTFA